ncbi:MAG: peptidylprolyl isomerase [Acutalibacteraceae bacterium]
MNITKRILLMLTGIAIVFSLVSCGYQGGANNSDGSDGSIKTEAYSNSPSDFTVTNTVEIKVKDYGTIVVDLYGNLAPITVKNFLKLVNEKFYDGLTFHRIISGFMIQGGAPKSGDVQPETIKGEYAANGIENNLEHKRGVISMARTAYDYDSASSQFFIMHADYPSLNGQYASFGMVRSGLDVVDKIATNNYTFTDDNGNVTSEQQPVIESIREVK